MFFENRTDAGQKLAQKILELNRNWTGWSVVGLARGGVIVAEPIAQVLDLPLQALCVKDFGLLTATSLNCGCERQPKISQMKFQPSLTKSKAAKVEGWDKFWTDLLTKNRLYNNGSDLRVPEKVIVCDDGLVSGRSAFTAIWSLSHCGAKQIILAVPVVLPWISKMKLGFELITWRTSTLESAATGLFYFNFPDTPDQEVIDATRRHAMQPA